MKQDPTPPDRDADVAPQAPGGATVNRVATVATSAALGGATAGALAGAFAGPVGAAVGAAVGALAAGFAGNAIAESIDTEAEATYWRDHYNQQPYVDTAAPYDDYGPAYGFGVEGYIRYQGRSFEEVEADLSREWLAARRGSSLDWDRARPASRDAWDRLLYGERRAPLAGDRDAT